MLPNPECHINGTPDSTELFVAMRYYLRVNQSQRWHHHFKKSHRLFRCGEFMPLSSV